MPRRSDMMRKHDENLSPKSALELGAAPENIRTDRVVGQLARALRPLLAWWRCPVHADGLNATSHAHRPDRTLTLTGLTHSIKASRLALSCRLSIPLISTASILPQASLPRKSGTYRRREPAHMYWIRKPGGSVYHVRIWPVAPMNLGGGQDQPTCTRLSFSCAKK